MGGKNWFNNRFSKKSEDSQEERTTEASRREPSFFITKSIQTSDIEKIVVNTTDAKIRFEQGEESSVCVSVTGSVRRLDEQTLLDGEMFSIENFLAFEADVKGEALNVSANFCEGITAGNMEVAISLPDELFEKISANSCTGDVEVCKGVKAAEFDVHSKTGNVNIYLAPQEDTKVKAKTTTGNVHIKRNGLRFGRFEVTSASIIENPFKKKKAKKGAHILNGYISTCSGTITIE